MKSFLLSLLFGIVFGVSIFLACRLGDGLPLIVSVIVGLVFAGFGFAIGNAAAGMGSANAEW